MCGGGEGALDGGSPMSPVDFKIVPCPLSILRKVNVPCHYFLFLSVDFKRVQCRLSNLRKGRVKGHREGGGAT